MIDFLVTLIIGFVALSLFISFLYGVLWLLIGNSADLDEERATRSGKEKTE